MPRAAVFVAVAAGLALVAAGCGSRCKEVAAARDALRDRDVIDDRGADVRVTVPLDRANALIAALLRAEPLSAALAVPDLGVLGLDAHHLTAAARSVRLRPGGPGTFRIAVELELRDGDALVTTLALEAEATPALERAGDATADDARADRGPDPGAAPVFLALGLGPENLIAVTPTLGPGATAALGDTLARWLPAAIRGRVPRPLLDAAAARLAAHLTGAAYGALRATLLTRLGEVTRLRLRLPDVPVDHTEVYSIATPAELLVIQITTNLRVRRGLAPPAAPPAEITVQLAGSAVAELANWAIDQGHAPRWYDRSLEPTPDGEFRPRFDYVAEDTAHPFKVYAFQERGGCSFFRVGVRATLQVDHGALQVTALDRALEDAVANPALEAAAWVKYFFTGSIDRSKSVAAHTQLSLGGHPLTTEVVAARLADHELTFGLRFALAPAAAAR